MEHAPTLADQPETEGEATPLRGVGVFLRPHDDSLHSEYCQHNLCRQTLSPLRAICICLAVFSVPYSSLLALAIARARTSFDYASSCAVLLLLVLTNVAGWKFYFVLKQSQGHDTRLTDRCRVAVQRAQKMIFFTINAIVCYRHLARVTSGACAQNNFEDLWSCNPTNQPARTIDMESATIGMLVPILYSVATRGADFEFAMLLWIVTVGTLIASVAYTQAASCAPLVFYYCLGSLTVLAEGRRQSYSQFFAHQHLHLSMKARAKEADEQQQTELRHMIANVAHDLKTPLSSFLAGVEFVAQVVVEMSEKLKGSGGGRISTADMSEFLGSIVTCVASMRNTNAFMLMTINRCIDYTKASKGMQLKPKHETVDLMETLSLPLNCMKDIQQRVCIELEPLAEDICSHVITDRQWLQENVLCLLSNAVKYSHDGAVAVRVAVVELDPFTRLSGPPSVPAPRSSEGRSALRLWAHTTTALRVEVEDHGIGLSDEAMASLFSPFKQAQRLAGGTGLGLFSLAKRLEALEGRCGVQRRRDGAEGSLFWFEVPYRADRELAKISPRINAMRNTLGLVTPSAHSGKLSNVTQSGKLSSLTASERLSFHVAANKSAKSERSSFSALDSQGGSLDAEIPRLEEDPLHVLVVDDSPAILKMTSMMLRRHKHLVSTASNGAEAVRAVKDRMLTLGMPFSVIVMDLQMPVMDGLEATKRLRSMEVKGSWFSSKKAAFPSLEDEEIGESPRCGKHVIIGVSANSDGETASLAYRMGVDAFLAKPFSFETFYSVYEQVLAAQLREQAAGGNEGGDDDCAEKGAKGDVGFASPLSTPDRSSTKSRRPFAETTSASTLRAFP